MAALVTAILTGGREADLYAATDAGLVLEPATTNVRGSGYVTSASVPDLTKPVVSHDGTTTAIGACVRRTLPRVIVATALAVNAVLRGTLPVQGALIVLATADGPSRSDVRAMSDHKRDAAPSGATHRALTTQTVDVAWCQNAVTGGERPVT